MGRNGFRIPMKIQWNVRTLLCITFLFAVLLTLDQLTESNSRSFQAAVYKTSDAGESEMLVFSEDPTAVILNIKAHPISVSFLDRFLFRRRWRVSYTVKVNKVDSTANSTSVSTNYHHLSSDFSTGIYGVVALDTN